MFAPAKQPPLQYYVRAIQHQEWDRVDIVTNGRTKNNITLNPVVPALEAMVKDGELTGNIHFHKVCVGVFGCVLPRIHQQNGWLRYAFAVRVVSCGSRVLCGMNVKLKRAFRRRRPVGWVDEPEKN